MRYTDRINDDGMLKKEIKRRDMKIMECLCDVETGVTVSRLRK